MGNIVKYLAADGQWIDLFQKFLNLFLIIVLAHMLAELSWKGVDFLFPVQQTAIGPQKAVQKDVRQSREKQQADLSRYADLHLFGKAERETGRKAEAVPTDAPKTTLSLILKGIIFSPANQKALAIIAGKAKQKEGEVYGVGDSVPGNAVIQEIYADRVILLRNGRHEILLLDEEAKEKAPIRSAAATAPDSGQIRSLGNGKNYEVSGSYLEQRLNDIPSLAREVGVEIYKEDGAQKGYKLVSARGSKLLNELGLQPGDVLREVNGVKLTSIHNGLAAYQQIKNSPMVRIVVERKGQRETRVYAIDRNM